ncbi:hypothetical protein MMC24_002498 [Lignoscripta atroalba]|nr:hypothetical protein [Lignoscripta atroalba]
MTDPRGGATKPKPESIVRLHSPYCEVTGPIVQPGLVSARILALQSAHDRPETPLLPRLTQDHCPPTKLSLKRKHPKRPLLSNPLAFASDTSIYGGLDRPEESVSGYGRRKTLSFGPPAGRTTSSVPLNKRGMAQIMASPFGGQPRTLTGDGRESQWRIAARSDEAGKAGVRLEEEPWIVEPVPIRQPMISRVASIANQLEGRTSNAGIHAVQQALGTRDPSVMLRKSIAEELCEMIDRALVKHGDDSYTQDVVNCPTPMPTGLVGNPFEKKRGFTERPDFTESPTEISPGTRTYAQVRRPLLQRELSSFQIRHSHLKQQYDHSQQRLHSRSPTTETILPRSSPDTEHYPFRESISRGAETPQSYYRAHTYHRRRSSHRESNTSIPVRSRTLPKSGGRPNQYACHDHRRLEIDIEQKYHGNTHYPLDDQGEVQHRQSLPEMRSPQSQVSSSSKKDGPPSTVSQRAKRKKWRWWKLVLVDKSSSRGEEWKKRSNAAGSEASGQTRAEHTNASCKHDDDIGTDSGFGSETGSESVAACAAHDDLGHNDQGLDYVESARRATLTPRAIITNSVDATYSLAARGHDEGDPGRGISSLSQTKAIPTPGDGSSGDTLGDARHGTPSACSVRPASPSERQRTLSRMGDHAPLDQNRPTRRPAGGSEVNLTLVVEIGSMGNSTVTVKVRPGHTGG